MGSTSDTLMIWNQATVCSLGLISRRRGHVFNSSPRYIFDVGCQNLFLRVLRYWSDARKEKKNGTHEWGNMIGQISRC